jgi:hypothetical protein
LIRKILVFSAAAMCASLLQAQGSFGIGVTAGTLGAGVQAAVSVAKYSNIRGGFNDFSYSDTFNKDGINYDSTLKLRSVQATWDQYFPHLGGFHVSPGALLYNGNAGNGGASVPAGQSFSLGSTTYYSGAGNPINGTGAISFRKAAPMVLLGFGNILPRSSRHFGISFEAGVVFEGSPNAKLNLAGTACATATGGCVNAATDPGVQANVQSEQTKLNNDLNPFKYYPVISLGFSYKVR